MLIRRALLGLLVIAGFAYADAPAFAQATRTWVSGVGDDANPCSRTAPCKTFAGTISKTAAGGEINCIDPGGFGAVTITKAITIDCTPVGGGILASGSNGILVNTATDPAAVVTIRNMSINGGPSVSAGLNGIRVIAVGALHVENVVIYQFSQKGIDFEPAGNAALFVRNSQISDNSVAVNGGGILIKPGASSNVLASIENTRLDRNLFGLRVEDRTKATVTNSVAASNTANGFLAVSAGGVAEINLHRTTTANNGTNGIQSNGAAALVTISYTSILDNVGAGISLVSGGTVTSFSPGTNVNAGNGSQGAPNGSAITLQ